ncbi:hypothetical protein VTK26DRAFT_2411 [Humicola hyalothermophila]
MRAARTQKPRTGSSQLTSLPNSYTTIELLDSSFPRVPVATWKIEMAPGCCATAGLRFALRPSQGNGTRFDNIPSVLVSRPNEFLSSATHAIASSNRYSSAPFTSSRPAQHRPWMLTIRLCSLMGTLAP